MFLLFINTSDVEQIGLPSCCLKVCKVISGLHRAAGRLFHRDHPETVIYASRSWFGLWELVVSPSRLT